MRRLDRLGGGGRRQPGSAVDGQRRGRLLGWRLWLMLLIGIFAYFTFLVAGMPAAVAWDIAQRHITIPQQIKVGTLAGTIWSGRAMGVGTAQLQAEQIDWRVHPGEFLRGQLGVDVEGRMAGGFAQGRVELTRDGLYVSSLNGRFPAAPWGPIAAELGGQKVALEGTFRFAIDKLEIGYAGAIHHADGRLAWHDAGVTVDHYARLGGITTTLTKTDGGLAGELGDTGGPLILAGNWWLDLASGRYEVDALVDTRDEAADILTRSLEMAGPRRDDGIHIGLEGSL